MTHHQPISSPRGLAAVELLRRMTEILPEVVEHVDGFGHTSFRIRDKPFVIMGEDEDDCWLSFKADPYTQDFLLKRDCFKRTPYIGQHGWTSVRTDDVPDWDEIRELVFGAFERAAPATLTRRMKEESGG